MVRRPFIATNHRRSDDELRQELTEQVEEFRARCEAFDKGTLWEAKGIAVSLYKLLHDGGSNSRSLLGMLNLFKTARFVSTARKPSEAVHERTGPNTFAVTRDLPMPPLIGLATRLDGSWTWAPRLDAEKDLKEMKFSKWWGETVFINERGLTLSRRNMVFTMRSQDGGAHVDPEIRDEAYREMATNAAPHISQHGELQDEKGRPIPNGHRATVRQIGWEMDQTLRGLGL